MVKRTTVLGSPAPVRVATRVILSVDDEPVARLILREELTLMPGVELIGEAGDGCQRDRAHMRLPEREGERDVAFLISYFTCI